MLQSVGKVAVSKWLAAAGPREPGDRSDKFTGGSVPSKGGFAKLETKFPVGSATACLTFGDQPILATSIADYAAGIPVTTGSASGECDAAKIKCVGKYVDAILGCHGKTAGITGGLDPACITKASAKLANGTDGCLDKAAMKSACTNPGSQAADLMLAADAFVEESLCALDPLRLGCP